MFLTNLLIASAVIGLLPDCLAANSPLQQFFNKKYRLVSSDSNFDKILSELGVSQTLRKGYDAAKPTLTLTWNPASKKYTFTEKSDVFSIIADFEIGKEVKEKTIDGRDITSVFTVHENTLTETQKQPGKTNLVIDRRFDPNHVFVKVEFKGITSNRVYDKI